MKAIPSILILALLGLTSANNVEIKSSDELILTYKPTEDTPLFLIPGTIGKLLFQLENKGEESRFSIRKSCSLEDMVGESVEEIHVNKNTYGTVLIHNIQVPNKPGTKVSYWLELTRLEDSMMSTMKTVKKEVILTIGEAPSDTKQPKIERKYTTECHVPRNDTTCENSRWHAEMEVQDDGVGLQSLEIKSVGKEHINQRMSFKYDNFAIGTTDKVSIITEVSCCDAGVSITATDLKGNQVTRDFLNGENGGAAVSSCAGILLVGVIMSVFFSH